jgi:two-component system NtrC family sensor kinase
MKTIRGKIISFSILCLAVASAVTAMFYQNAFSLKRKIYTIERFDDLLNDVLELRRYEKNLIFYRDAASLKEGVVYLLKVDNDFKILKDDIVGIIGMDECRAFSQNLVSYKQILDNVISMKEVRSSQKQVEKLRTEGKSLVDFAQRLIQIKRKRIDATLKRALAIPVACVGGLIVLVAVIFRFVNRGILKPLSMIEEATEKVAKESFKPII